MRTIEFEDVRDRCLSKAHVTEEFPFDENTCVWKVAGKVFALADIDAFDGVTLKCEPEYAVELRTTHRHNRRLPRQQKALEYRPVGSRCSTCVGPRLD